MNQQGSIQALLPTSGNSNIIVCDSDPYFQSPVDFAHSMTCMFLQARKPITVTSDDGPGEYISHIRAWDHPSHVCLVITMFPSWYLPPVSVLGKMVRS